MKLPEWLMDLVVAAHQKASGDPNNAEPARSLAAYLHHCGEKGDSFHGELGKIPSDLDAIKMACGVVGTEFVQRDEASCAGFLSSYLFINPRPSLSMVATHTSFETDPLDTVLCQADEYLEFIDGELASY
ncbi:hypothetical protein [Ralstonia sp. ASV6]|uniref:hypothetical protein n=1 Tax=Ralstonia sp. ASV6 TaxID=2795124 RepID=UPI0018EC30B2|nr:hypothetical protein [Ralstonia sp. ASV6]